jgi:hypothetical protein
MEARYPGDWDPVEESETREAFEMVKKIRDVMKVQLAHVLPAKEQE